MKIKGVELVFEEDRAKLYLYGTIRKKFYWENEDDELDYVSAEGVRKALIAIGDKPIEVHINSSGGDVFESIAIHNLLEQHTKTITMYVDGLAGSGASIIFMAGVKNYMPNNAMLMLHQVSTIAEGNADELRKVAIDLETIDSSVRETYKKRFIGTEDELKKIIAASSWLTAEQARAFNLCDEIVKDKQEIKANGEEVILNLFEKYRLKGGTPKEESIDNKSGNLFMNMRR